MDLKEQYRIETNKDVCPEYSGESYTDDYVHWLENKLTKAWVKYDFMDLSSRPPKPGKYFVHRKDGKVHWETWNGSGWAYNEKVITYWQDVIPPE